MSNSTVHKLKTLAEHPNTPIHERLLALKLLKQFSIKNKQVKSYLWTDFSKLNEDRVNYRV